MKHDPCDHACRMGMLVVAILHWVALGLMIWNDVAGRTRMNDVEVVSGILAAIVRLVTNS